MGNPEVCGRDGEEAGLPAATTGSRGLPTGPSANFAWSLRSLQTKAKRPELYRRCYPRRTIAHDPDAPDRGSGRELWQRRPSPNRLAESFNQKNKRSLLEKGQTPRLG